MHNIKREVVNAIADLPETAGLDDIVAVVEKIRLAEDYVVQPPAHRASNRPLSFSAAARKYSGCLPGAPADLSTNSAHLVRILKALGSDFLVYRMREREVIPIIAP